LTPAGVGNIFSAQHHFARRTMKTLITKFALFTLAALTVGVIAASAQITTQVDFKMTQSFVVGNTTLPPGSYVITVVSGSDQSVIQIASATGKPSVMVDAELVSPPAAAQAGSQLVFNKYKSVVALSQVFPGGGAQGYQLTPGHPEKIAAKAEKPTKQTVASTTK
jgi:hypothetical protein